MKNEEIASGIYTALKPVYFVCKVLGLVTYNYVKNKNNNKMRAIYGHVTVVYSMVWILFCVAALSYTLLCFHTCDPQDLPQKMRIASYVYYIILYITCLACYVNAIFSGRNCPLVLKKLSLVDSLLFRQQEEEYVNRKSMLISLAETVIVFVVNFLMSWFYIYTDTQDTCFTTCLKIVESVTTYLNSMAVVNYCQLVRVTHERYKQMNRQLFGCMNHASRDNCVKYNTYQGQSRFVIQGNILTLGVSPTDFRSVNRLQFRYLRIILSELNYIVSLINKNYGISAFSVTCWILVSVITVLFFTLLETENGQYAGVGYLIFSFFLLMNLSWTCHTAASENDTSKFLVQKLLLQDDLTPKEITELKLLTFQLNNVPVQYSACGFFVLNLPFMCNVTGVIISYAMIIIQLQ